MSTLYLISIIFGLIIFMVLITLISLEDQKAKYRIQARFLDQETLEKISWIKKINPLLDAIKIPDFLTQIVDQQAVIWSGIQLTHHQFSALWWLLNVFGVMVGALLIGLGFGDRVGSLITFVVVLLFAVGPYLYLKFRIRERQRAVERSLPDFLDMLTFTVEAGLGLVPALQRVSKGFSGPLGEEMSQALVKIDLGFSRREALKGLANRIPSPDVEQFVEAILLSERLGTSLARTMRVQASLLRTRRRQRAEIKAQTAPIRIIPALVFFFLPSLLLIYLAPPIINFLLRR